MPTRAPSASAAAAARAVRRTPTERLLASAGTVTRRVDLSDAVFELLWLFSGGLTPDCLDAADANADRVHDLSDAVFTLDFLFQSGPAPPAPGPSECGTAEDSIGCVSCAPCET